MIALKYAQIYTTMHAYPSMKNPAQILRDALKNAGLSLDHWKKAKGLYWLRTLGFAPIIGEFASFAFHELQEITGSLDTSRDFQRAVDHQKALVRDVYQTPNAWGVLQVWCPDVNGDLWIAGDRHALNNLKQCIEIALESEQQYAAFLPRSAFVTGGRGGDPFLVEVQLADPTGINEKVDTSAIKAGTLG